MSETTSNGGQPNDNEEHSLATEKYTVRLNGTRYELNEEARESIETRAANEYEENNLFSSWWRTATTEDERDPDTVHQRGDPILVIETEGPIVPWEKLDQLELEEQDTSSFGSVDSGSGSDVDEGGGMKTIKPGEVQDGSGENREENRTHFGVTPQDFEEVPTPDGEDPDRVPAKREQFDEPTMVMFLPEHPEITHSWSAGEAMVPMNNWVEWNVQAKAEQPHVTRDEDDSHNHWESLLQMHECEQLGDIDEGDDGADSEASGSAKRKGDRFEDGIANGDNWNV